MASSNTNCLFLSMNLRSGNVFIEKVVIWDNLFYFLLFLDLSNILKFFIELKDSVIILRTNFLNYFEIFFYNNNYIQFSH